LGSDLSASAELNYEVNAEKQDRPHSMDEIAFHGTLIER
jgi:hypothetical protein